MKPRLVEYLACPDCRGDLRLERRDGERGEIMEGELRCLTCHRLFAVHRGVPRLLPAGIDRLAVEVADGFGWEWNQFDEVRPHYHQQFLDWLAPLAPDDFRDQMVLEGGCGKGRHSALVAGYGAHEVFAVDLGSSVEAAFRNTQHLGAVHVIQGDIARLPLKVKVDLAFSVGVLHHMPDPVVGFRALVEQLRPGGRIAVWVYGHEGNEWIVKYVDPVRTRFTSKMPRRLLYEAARPPAWLLAAAAKGLYAPLTRLGAPGRALHERLFYRDYLTYVARFPLRELHSIVFDHLVTPVSHYLRREEVEAWFAMPQLEDVTVEQHNGNSWRAHARRQAAPAAVAAAHDEPRHPHARHPHS